MKWISQTTVFQKQSNIDTIAKIVFVFTIFSTVKYPWLQKEHYFINLIDIKNLITKAMQ